jgi:chemotaxis protein CheD
METSIEKKEHFLYPGAFFAQKGEYTVSTILGSCVAVCLWDPVLRIGGINHYMMDLWNG